MGTPFDPMASKDDPTSTILALGQHQDGVVHYHQLRALGLTDRTIRHRVATGWLHPRWPWVYVVGRPELSRMGEWRAAVLTCGPGAVLSHLSAAVAWGIWRVQPTEIEVSIPRRRCCRRDGMVVHRLTSLRFTHDQIAHDPEHVQRVLECVACRPGSPAPAPSPRRR